MCKQVFVLVCYVLVLATIHGDEADQIILSYNQNRRAFNWAQLTDANREAVVLLLKQIKTGERDNVAGRYLILPAAAEEMLIAIGDDDTIRDVIDRYHTKQFGRSNIVDVVEAGQAKAIPLLAEDLVSDKNHFYQEAGPDGRIMRTQDGDKAYHSAQNIVWIAVHSRQLPDDVRLSAKALLAQFNYRRRAIGISQVTTWWLQNEPWFTTQQYDKVAPFPALAPENPKADPPIENLALQIRKARGQKDAGRSTNLMREFVATWKPIGRSAGSLVEQVGLPDEKTPTSLQYRFDAGYGGWIWIFKIADGKVVDFVEVGMD
jgi:hypothetical protein